MRLTNRDKSNLARFGCTFLARPKLIAIRAEKSWKNQILSAGIVARLIYKQCPSGPVLSLAFEISPTRALPRYFLLPFDVTSTRHRNYLSGVFRNGQIRLLFLVDSSQISRTHEIRLPHCQKLAEMYATALADLEKFPAETYDYETAVNELEQSIRIVDYFAYVIPESEIQRLIVSSRAQAENASLEDRAEARQIATEFLAPFRARYDSYVRQEIQEFPSYGRSFQALADLHSAFEGDYEKAVQFETDVIATHTPKEDNQQLPAAIPLLELILKFMDYIKQSSAADQQTVAAREAEFQEIVNRMATQGPSFEALKSIASILGFHGGQPGRAAKDYSKEYELKAEGQTWPQVAAYMLNHDSELREAYGGRPYKALTFKEQHDIRNRVRERARSYSKRTGKPFPPKRTSHSQYHRTGEQKNSD